MGLVFVSSYSILLLDTISFSPSSSSLDEASLPNNTPTPELYSSGAAAGYSFTKPFVISNTANAAYIGSDGFLYSTGQSWGGGTFYKQTNAGGGSANTIVDYETGYLYGITVDTSGVVRRGAANTSTSATWNTVTVGGVTSGHQAVAISEYYQMVLAKDGSVYVSNDGATTMSSIAITSTVASNNGGVKDISVGRSYQYVLFNNGALYGGTAGGTSMSSIATGVKMFDYDGTSTSYVYIYNSSNQIQVAAAAGSGTHSFTTLVTESGVKQIRGGYNSSSWYSGWGYINSSNVLKTYESSYNSTSVTRTVDNVAYFDNAGYDGEWGYLTTSGQIYLWHNGHSRQYITSKTSPTIITSATSGASNSSLGTAGVPNLGGGISDISSTPPTNKKRLN